jgi:hypothetical protein
VQPVNSKNFDVVLLNIDLRGCSKKVALAVVDAALACGSGCAFSPEAFRARKLVFPTTRTRNAEFHFQEPVRGVGDPKL